MVPSAPQEEAVALAETAAACGRLREGIQRHVLPVLEEAQATALLFHIFSSELSSRTLANRAVLFSPWQIARVGRNFGRQLPGS